MEGGDLPIHSLLLLKAIGSYSAQPSSSVPAGREACCRLRGLIWWWEGGRFLCGRELIGKIPPIVASFASNNIFQVRLEPFLHAKAHLHSWLLLGLASRRRSSLRVFIAQIIMRQYSWLLCSCGGEAKHLLVIAYQMEVFWFHYSNIAKSFSERFIDYLRLFFPIFSRFNGYLYEFDNTFSIEKTIYKGEKNILCFFFEFLKILYRISVHFSERMDFHKCDVIQLKYWIDIFLLFSQGRD
jgi:hypothetical protein